MLTTMTAMLGGVPLPVGGGTGSELRQPLGITIVGGLIGQPGADAVHDPGYLSLFGPAAALGGADVAAPRAAADTGHGIKNVLVNARRGAGFVHVNAKNRRSCERPPVQEKHQPHAWTDHA
jgi:hypothetical protein